MAIVVMVMMEAMEMETKLVEGVMAVEVLKATIVAIVAMAIT